MFADVGDLAVLELPAPTVNWQYLAAFIYSSQAQVRASAFNEIHELLAGECLRVQSHWYLKPRSGTRARSVANGGSNATRPR